MKSDIAKYSINNLLVDATSAKVYTKTGGGTNGNFSEHVLEVANKKGKTKLPDIRNVFNFCGIEDMGVCFEPEQNENNLCANEESGRAAEKNVDGNIFSSAGDDKYDEPKLRDLNMVVKASSTSNTISTASITNQEKNVSISLADKTDDVNNGEMKQNSIPVNLRNPNYIGLKDDSKSDLKQRKSLDQSSSEVAAKPLPMPIFSPLLSIADTLGNAANIQGIKLDPMNQKTFPNQVLQIAQGEYCARYTFAGLTSFREFVLNSLDENLAVNFFNQDQINGIIDGVFEKLLGQYDVEIQQSDTKNCKMSARALKNLPNKREKLENDRKIRSLAKQAIKSALILKALSNANMTLTNCYLGTVAKVIGCSIMVKIGKCFVLYRHDGGFCVEQNFRQTRDVGLVRGGSSHACNKDILLREKDFSIIKSAIFVEYDGTKLSPMNKETKDTLIAASAKDTEA